MNTQPKKKSPEIVRLKACLRELGFSTEDLAETTGIAQRTIDNIIWTDQPIGGRLLRKLHQRCGVSVDWLLSGAGEMFAGKIGQTQTNKSPLVPAFQQTDNTDAQDVFIIAAAAIEQAMLQCGATPGKDYKILDLFRLAAPFVLERCKDGDADLKLFT